VTRNRFIGKMNRLGSSAPGAWMTPASRANQRGAWRPKSDNVTRLSASIGSYAAAVRPAGGTRDDPQRTR